MSDNKEIPALVVFGLDDQRKPRAGTFRAGEMDEARRRAANSRLVAVAVEEEKLVAAVRSLSAGDLSKPGAAFVPIVVRTVYEQVLAASAITGSPSQSSAFPRAAGPGASSPPRLPASREQITVGDMVLVADLEPGDGWYEAIVVEEVSADIFRLKYRDYPEHPVIIGNRRDFALLPSAK